MTPHERTDLLLAVCGGFDIEAVDGIVGRVETPLFPPAGGAPDFLVVRVHERFGTRRPVVPVALVEGVDPELRLVHFRGRRSQLIRLPEHVPLAI